MDSKSKASYRAKIEASRKLKKLDKRIDSPLVRYNESDQPVCRVCELVLKSDSHWEAHKVSTKHHEAINNYKANAAKLAQASKMKPQSQPELRKQEAPVKLQGTRAEPTEDLPKPQPSSVLPANFFDNQPKQKKPKVEAVNRVDSAKTKRDEELTNTPENATVSDIKQSKGALPEGFFDNKDADLRARGVEPVKLNVKDEYKEFEKLIQEDLKEVDDRFEEEEFDAAETIEEAETIEQRMYMEKVEAFRKKQMELKASRLGKRNRVPEPKGNKSVDDDSSSDDDSDVNFAVDWRAQHL